MRWVMKKFIFAFLLLSELLISCGGTLGGNPEGKIRRQDDAGANLSLALSSTSVDYAKNVFVRVESVEVSTQGQNWSKLELSKGLEIDLLNLGENNSVALGQISQLKATSYEKLRLNFSAIKTGRVIESNGSEVELNLPADQTSNISLEISLTLSSQKSNSLVIAIDLQRSLAKVSGKYELRPKLSIGEVALTGTLTGIALPGYVVCVFKEGASPDSEESCPNALATTGGGNSKFYISALLEGNYVIRVFQNKTKVRDYPNVPIKASTVTDLGDVSSKKTGSVGEDREDRSDD